MIAAGSLRVVIVVSLDVDSSTSAGTRSSAHATTMIDRRDFGMTYGGFAVGKQVVITIEAVGMNTTADASTEEARCPT